MSAIRFHPLYISGIPPWAHGCHSWNPSLQICFHNFRRVPATSSLHHLHGTSPINSCSTRKLCSQSEVLIKSDGDLQASDANPCLTRVISYMALGPPYPNDSCDLFHKMRRNVKGITNKIQKDVQKKIEQSYC